MFWSVGSEADHEDGGGMGPDGPMHGGMW
jgi:hypothetical protein